MRRRRGGERRTASRVNLPTMVVAGLPKSMSTELALFLKNEQSLSRQLGQLQASIRQRLAKNQAAEDFSLSKQLHDIESNLLQLISRKKEVYAELSAIDASSSRSEGLQSVLENIAILRMSRTPLQEEYKAMKQQTVEYARKINDMKLNAEKAKTKLPTVSMDEYEKRERIIERKIASIKQDYKFAQADSQPLEKELTQLAKNKHRIGAYWEMVEELFDTQRKQMECQARLKDISIDLEVINKRVEMLLSERDELMQMERPGPEAAKERQRRRELQEELIKINLQWKELNERKLHLRDSMRKPRDTALAEEIRQREQLKQQLADLRQKVAIKSIPYDSKLHNEVVGPQNSTLICMQEEFAVEITVRPFTGMILIRGAEEDVNACTTAVSELLSSLDDRTRETLTYDPDLFSTLVGKNGQTIERMRVRSGAEIIVRDSGEIEISGKAATVAKARTFITEFNDTHHRDQLSFIPELLDTIVGPKGSTIAQIQYESGAQIRVDPDDSVIVFEGREEQIEAAKAAYEELLAEFDAEGIALTFSLKHIDLLRKRKVLETTAEETGTHIVQIDSRDEESDTPVVVVVIKGPKRNLKSAQKQIEQFLDDFSVESIKIPFPEPMVSFFIRQTHTSEVDGRRVCLVEKFQEDYECRVVRVNRTSFNIVVVGTKRQAELCAEALKQLIEDNKAEFEIMTVRVNCPPILRGFLLRPTDIIDENTGKRVRGPCELEKARRQTRCIRVFLDENEDQVEIAITGTLAQTTKCQELIQKILAENKISTSEIPFNPLLFNYLTRRQGRDTVLDTIKKETGCEMVTIARNTATVTFTGREVPLDAATKKLTDLLQQKSNDIKTVPLPNQRIIGSIIGPKGATIAQITKESGCDANIDRENLEVQLFGSEEAIIKATEMIQNVLNQISQEQTQPQPDRQQFLGDGKEDNAPPPSRQQHREQPQLEIQRRSAGRGLGRGRGGSPEGGRGSGRGSPDVQHLEFGFSVPVKTNVKKPQGSSAAAAVPPKPSAKSGVANNKDALANKDALWPLPKKRTQPW